jgi:hypothetical protein
VDLLELALNATAKVEIRAGSRVVDWGTGFLAGQRHLLTAFHVVAEKVGDGVRQKGELHLLFRAAGNQTSAARLVGGDAELDWALLECEAPPPNVLPLALGTIETAPAPFAAYGFAHTNPRDGHTFSGRVENPSTPYERVRAIQLFADQAAAGAGAPVQGLSGSACVVGGVVVGVVRSFIEQGGRAVAGTIYACPSQAILASPLAGPLLRGDVCRGLPPLPAELAFPEEPFRYLSFYRADEARVFFGRCKEVEQLHRALCEAGHPDLVLLCGQSGVGKSSLLQAGLLPRIASRREAVYRRRSQEDGLRGTLATALGAEAGDVEGLARALAARAGGSTGARPSVVILDQVEEAFTRPRPGQTPEAELAELFQSLQRLAQSKGRSPGQLKVVLSFRKSWSSEIEDAARAWGLPALPMFIAPMNRASVKEVVLGLTSSDDLRKEYRLEVEPELAAQIAEDLTRDADSPIATSLQVLLTDLWSAARASSFTRRAFTAALYEPFRHNLGLDKFLERQLGQLDPTVRPHLDSGLVLDVLAFHTTSDGNADSRTEQQLRQAYRDKAPEVDQIVAELRRVALLTEPSDEGTASAKTTRLIHDTLARVVRRRFLESPLPGQRARRVLESRAPDWHYGLTGPVIDEVDLATVVRGGPGMRTLDVDELRCLAASLAWATSRRRRRFAVAAATSIAVVLALLGWNRSRVLGQDMEVERATRAATRAQTLFQEAARDYARERDPLAALFKVVAAVEVAPAGDPHATLYVNRAIHLAAAGPVAALATARANVARARIGGGSLVTVDTGGGVAAARFTVRSLVEGVEGTAERRLEMPPDVTLPRDPGGPGSNALVLSTDGRWLAGRPVAATSWIIWDTTSGKAALSIDDREESSIVFARDASVIVAWTVRRREGERERDRDDLDHSATVRAVREGTSWRPERRTVAANVPFLEWSGRNHVLVAERTPGPPPGASVLANDSGKALVSTRSGCALSTVDLRDTSRAPGFFVPGFGCERIAVADVSEDGSVALLLRDDVAIAWNATTKAVTKFFAVEPWGMFGMSGMKKAMTSPPVPAVPRRSTAVAADSWSLALSPEGTVAAARTGGYGWLWKREEKTARPLDCHRVKRWLPDGASLVCGYYRDGDLESVIARDGAQVSEPIRTEDVSAVIASGLDESGRFVLTLGAGGELRVMAQRPQRTAGDLGTMGRAPLWDAVFVRRGQAVIAGGGGALARWSAGSSEPAWTKPVPGLLEAVDEDRARLQLDPEERVVASMLGGPEAALKIGAFEIERGEQVLLAPVLPEANSWQIKGDRLTVLAGGRVLTYDGSKYVPGVATEPGVLSRLTAGSTHTMEAVLTGDWRTKRALVKVRSLLDGREAVLDMAGATETDSLLRFVERLAYRAEPVILAPVTVRLQAPNGLKLDALSMDGHTTLWSADRKRRIQFPAKVDLPPESYSDLETVTGLRYAIDDGAQLVAVAHERRVRVFWYEGELVTDGLWHPATVLDLAFVRRGDSTYLRTVAADGRIREWFVFDWSGRRPGWIAGLPMVISGRALGPDGQTMQAAPGFLQGPGRRAFFQALAADGGEPARLVLKQLGD